MRFNTLKSRLLQAIVLTGFALAGFAFVSKTADMDTENVTNQTIAVSDGRTKQTILSDEDYSSTETKWTLIQDPILGANITGVRYYGTQDSFLNIVKSSQGWISQDKSKEPFKGTEYTDKHGNITRMPPNDKPRIIVNLSHLKAGDRYVVMHDGEGELEFTTGWSLVSKPAPNRYIVKGNRDRGRFANLHLKSTNPNDYLRNLRVVMEKDLDLYENQVFGTEMIGLLEDFHVLRFMDWGQTNGSNIVNWAQRPKVDDVTYTNGGGIPLEVIADLSNRIIAHPWICIPHQANDDYIRRSAELMRDMVDPRLNVYVEYSNEVWNRKFQQTSWVEDNLVAPNKPNGVKSKVATHYANRAADVMEIYREVFAEKGQADRVVGVLASKAVSDWHTEQMLMYLQHNNKLDLFDVVAIAPYFGGKIGDDKNMDYLVEWATSGDAGMDKLFQELRDGSAANLPKDTKAGAIHQAIEHAKKQKVLADQYGLELVAYEGGQHLAGGPKARNNNEVADMFVRANRDPQMETLYSDYFAQWYQLGGGMFAHFGTIGESTKFGSWNIIENKDDQTSSKKRALFRILEDHKKTK
ncbi:MAG: hypothetical protein ACFBSC_17815 [Microcoleaceae cyanobacterium]